MIVLKVGVAVTGLDTIGKDRAIDTLKPVPIVKTCFPPCKGKTPCLRICPRFATKPFYPTISRENLKACTPNETTATDCRIISSSVGNTLFGDINGILKKYHNFL